MKKDNSKFQKQAPLLVFCLIFLFSDQPSKSSGCPFSKAKGKAAKVVKFVAMWLNLYPHTVNHNFFLKKITSFKCKKSQEVCQKVNDWTKSPMLLGPQPRVSHPELNKTHTFSQCSKHLQANYPTSIDIRRSSSVRRDSFTRLSGCNRTIVADRVLTRSPRRRRHLREGLVWPLTHLFPFAHCHTGPKSMQLLLMANILKLGF